MAAERIEIVLDLNDSQARLRVEGTTKALDILGKSLRRLDKGLVRSERKVAGLVHRMRDLFVILGQARGSIRTLWGLTGQWTGAIIQQNAELERMTALMTGLSREADGMARQLEALSNVQFILDFSTNAPFSVQALTDSFVKLKTAGLDPAAGSLQNLTDAVAAFGGDDAILKRASVALLQMSGKGVVSMEELRQQLGEAVPSAMKLMARSANLSMGEFVKLVSQGKVEATDALQRLSNEFALVFGGRGAALMETFNGQLAKFRVNMTLLSKEVGDAGFFPEIKTQLEEINKLLLSSDVKVFAREFGQALTSVAKSLVDAGKFAAQFKDEVIFLTKALVVLMGGKVLGKIIGPLAASAAKLISVARAAGSATAAIGILRGAWLAFIAITPAGVIAAVTTALWLGYEAWQKYGNAAERAMNIQAQIQRNNNKGLLTSSGSISDAEGQIERASAALEKFQNIIANEAKPNAAKLKAAGSLKDINEALGLDLDVFEDSFDDIMAIVGNTIRGLNREIGQAKQITVQDFIDTNIAKEVEGQLEEVRKVQSQFAPAFEAIANDVNVGDATSRQGAEARKALLIALAQETAKAYEEAIAEAQARLRNTAGRGTDQAAQLIAAELEELAKKNKEQADRLAVQIKATDVDIRLIDSADNKKADTFLKYLTGIKEKFNEVTAKGAKASTVLAEFRSRLGDNDGSGAFGIISPEDIANIEMWIQKLDEAKARVDLLKSAEKSRGKLEDQLAKIRADLTTSELELSGNVYSKVSAGMTAVNRLIAQQKSELDRAKTSYDQIAAASPLAFDLLALLAYNDQMAEINKLFAELIKAQQQVDAVNTAIGFQKIADSARDAIASMTGEGAAANFEAQRIELQELGDAYDAMMANSKDLTHDMFQAMNDFDNARALLVRKHALENRTQLEVLIDDWSDVTDEMQDVWASAMEGLADSFLGFIETGKFAFEDFMVDILKMLAKIAIQRALAGLVDIAIGAFGGSSASSGIGIDSSGQGYGFAKGGVMSSGGPLDLNAYADGGVASKPQLALFGEGSMNEAFVPLPDGRSIPVTMDGGMNTNVQVNVINQSGQNVEAKEQNRQFDGKKMVLDIVLEATSRQGSFRDNMKASLR